MLGTKKYGRLCNFTLAAALLIGVAAAPAVAQSFPDEPITVVVAWPAGGGHDTVTRLVTEHLSQELSTSVVVTNVPGAAGANGVRQVEEADADGYTLGVLGVHATAQSYMNANATDLINLDPLAVINIEPAALAVRRDTGIDSFEAFLEYAHNQPGGIINGNDSPGGFSFLNAAFIESYFEIELTKVPYQGYAPTVAALVSGEVMSTTLPVPMLADLHDSETIQILGVAATERHFRVPEVPTFAEMGYDYVMTDYVMVFGPRGIEDERRATLETALLAAMEQEAFQERGRAMGLMLSPGGAEAAVELMRSMDDLIYPVMQDADLVSTRER
ncbi:Bug family tripartite tricarboxylate transporter substrate binding protein [Pararhodobacter oceanensis]|nr:tripartite tricarboxylate transporter substrate binding protein [Pararhodobacter oceanensis]